MAYLAFLIVRRLEPSMAKYMMRSDNLHWHDHGRYTEMTTPYLNINDTDEDESKRIIMHETLLENVSTEVRESERNIVNEILSQNSSADIS